MKREPGFYWVKYHGKWFPLEFTLRPYGTTYAWRVPSESTYISQTEEWNYFDDIDETKLIPPTN